MSKVRQVEELMVGNAVSSEATVEAFVSDASAKELGVFNVDGTAVAANEPFKILQKTDDGLNPVGYEFSEKIYPEKVERVTVVEYAPETQREEKVTGFADAVEENCTYVVEIRFYNPMGVHSPENFEIISGYYVTGSRVTNVTPEDIVDGLVESLNLTLKHRGGKEFIVESTADSITIKGYPQYAVPGKDEGRMVQFEVAARVFDNLSPVSEDLELLEVEVVNPGNPGRGTGKFAVNLEWFTKGFKYDVYRETAYPANFATPFYTDQGQTYNVIHIHHYDDRISPDVERQYKTVTILIEDADTDATNDVLGKLRTAITSGKVPADIS